MSIPFQINSRIGGDEEGCLRISIETVKNALKCVFEDYAYILQVNWTTFANKLKDKSIYPNLEKYRNV